MLRRLDDDLEHRFLATAQAGDEHAFRQLVELHRSDLHAHCYRMLGSLQDAARVLGDAHVARLVKRFATALEEGDIQTLAGLLADDVVFDMPPHRGAACGRDDVAASWLVPSRRPTGLQTIVTRINGQPAIAVYRSPDPRSPAHRGTRPRPAATKRTGS